MELAGTMHGTGSGRRKPSIHENGWSVQNVKSRFTCVRNSHRKTNTSGGLQVEREISRRKERAHWRLIKKSEPGWLSRFGDLVRV